MQTIVKPEVFPFKEVRVFGIVFLVSGVVMLALGIADVVFTVCLYTGIYDNCPVFWPLHLEDPCDNTELKWTWVAAGVWGGFILIVDGIMGLSLSPSRVQNLRLQRDLFGVFCILKAFPVLPAVIVLSGMEIYFGDDIFYNMDSGVLKFEEVTKFVLPLLVAILAFLVWIVAIIGAVVVCCNPETEKKQSMMYQQPYGQPIMLQAPPQQQPMILQAPPQQSIMLQAPPPQQMIVMAPPAASAYGGFPAPYM